jgi:hypothetical protein
MSARGKLKERNWKRANGTPATIDDISVFVIPILPYKEEYQRSQVFTKKKPGIFFFNYYSLMFVFISVEEQRRQL